jgi:hypothetical protein
MPTDSMVRTAALKIWAGGLAVALAVGLAFDAHAVSLSLQGNEAGVEMDAAQALYGSNNSGGSVLVTAVGQPAPEGGKFSEIGVPSMMPDGRVLFGAEASVSDQTPRWNIYFGDPDGVAGKRVWPALALKGVSDECAPTLHGDPYPVGDADGQIAFLSATKRGGDALFLYSHGKLTCLARVGSKTNQGHQIAVLSFGSPQVGEPGEVAFNAWLAGDAKDATHNHRQSLLLASPTGGITELAVEGELGPNRTQYMRPFGLPTAIASPIGTMVAFTAKTPTGAALFLWSGGEMARILPTGTLTLLGPVSYLSPGRPGLMPDGTAAVLAGCAHVPAIFRLSHQRLDLRIQRGQLTPFGTELESLGDPSLTATGEMFVGATDTDNREKLYVLDRDDAFFEVGEPDLIYRIAIVGPPAHHHSIFTGTLSVNERGDFAYLGGK